MRITNIMMNSNFLANLNSTAKRMYSYQTQLAGNSRINRLSDDPVGVVNSLRARMQVIRSEQYSKNAEDASGWLSLTESALNTMNDIFVRAYELAQDSANSVKTDQDRQAISFEVEQLMSNYMDVLNSSDGSRYLFGGYNTTRKPFTFDEDGKLLYNKELLTEIQPTPENENEILRYEVGVGILMDVSLNGINIVGTGEGNGYQLLQNLLDRLRSESPMAELETSIGEIKEFQRHILACLSEVGGRGNRIDMMLTRYDSDVINFKAMAGNVEDIDVSEIITRFKMEETVYRTALSVGQRIIQPTLADFLR